MEGSLTGFSLREIFEMLSVTKKTGVIEIEDAQGLHGRVAFKEGRLYWAESRNANGPLAAGADRERHLKERFEDAVLEIFDIVDCAYSFKVDEEVSQEEPIYLPVGSLLESVIERQTEWARIRTEIPTMRAKVELINKLEAETISLSREQWQIISLIGKNATVEELQAELKVSPLAVCRSLFEMSKMHLIRCLGEVVDEETGPRSEPAEFAGKAPTRKYVRRSLRLEENADSGVPAEWSSYYQLLDSRKVAAKGAVVAKAQEH